MWPLPDSHHVELLGDPPPSVPSLCWLKAESTRGVGSPREWQNCRAERAWVGKTAPYALYRVTVWTSWLVAVSAVGWHCSIWCLNSESSSLCFLSSLTLIAALQDTSDPCYYPEARVRGETTQLSPCISLLPESWGQNCNPTRPSWGIYSKEPQTYGTFGFWNQSQGHYEPSISCYAYKM